MTPAAPATKHCSATATSMNGNASMPSPASVDAAVTSTQTCSTPSLSLQTSVSPSKTLSKREALSPDTGFSSAPNVTSKKPKLFSGSCSPSSDSEVHSPCSAPSTAAASMPAAKATLAAATLASSDSSSVPTPVSPTPGAPIHAFGDTNFFPIGEALQSTISHMVNMGFEPDQVQRALRASYNNPDRAVEYLTTEIPADLDAEAAAAVQGSPASRDPQFEQVRQSLMQNPEPFLRLLAVQNPEMAQVFTANPEVLVQLLAAVGSSEGEESPLPSAQAINVPREDRAAIEQPLLHLINLRASSKCATSLPSGHHFTHQLFEQQQQQPGASTGLGAPVAGSSRDPQFQQFWQHLMQNPEPFLHFLAVQNPEMAQAFAANPEVLVQLLAAVGDSEGEEDPLPSAQLEALGFSQSAAIEAYLVCDKDEELAANYLLENASLAVHTWCSSSSMSTSTSSGGAKTTSSMSILILSPHLFTAAAPTRSFPRTWPYQVSTGDRVELAQPLPRFWAVAVLAPAINAALSSFHCASTTSNVNNTDSIHLSLAECDPMLLLHLCMDPMIHFGRNTQLSSVRPRTRADDTLAWMMPLVSAFFDGLGLSSSDSRDFGLAYSSALESRFQTHYHFNLSSNTQSERCYAPGSRALFLRWCSWDRSPAPLVPNGEEANRPRPAVFASSHRLCRMSRLGRVRQLLAAGSRTGIFIVRVFAKYLAQMRFALGEKLISGWLYNT
ncbi:hypothetical protein B0H13DRAFT_1911269 [Mycena leptocephala]|nr:hypothetical protein B0H13DRAFT_1911269 [Mycena leptocephala]